MSLRHVSTPSGSVVKRASRYQSGTPFGAPTALRIGAGSAADLELLDAALAAAGFSGTQFSAG